MILWAINCDGDIWCGRVFWSVSMPGDKGRTELLPVRFHEWSDLVFGQVFRRIKKVERIPAHGQFICFVDHDAQCIALPEIARIPMIAKEARLGHVVRTRT